MTTERGCPAVCLITTVQPSSNPRLLKEADTLADAGYRVHVVGAWYSEWAEAFDKELLRSRQWQFTCVDWRRGSAPWLFWKTRVRHRAARFVTEGLRVRSVAWRSALSRFTPELVRAVAPVRADLYVAHNLGALPAALAAASNHRGALGFDAEDFHSGQVATDDSVGQRAFLERLEQRLLPRCDYLTAASPMIAEAYERLTGVRPTCILNVFPTSERPPALRVTEPGAPLRLYWFSQTIGRKRGLEDVVRAMGRLRGASIELHLRGRWQAGYKEALLRIAADSLVKPDQIVHHEPASPTDMVKLAAVHDVGLAIEPGVSENNEIALSNKIFTYLLGGLAVVATRTRAQASLAPQLGASVLTYQAGDVDALAAGLRSWLEHPDRLWQARQAAWQLGESRYNWDVEKAKFLDVVETTLRRRAGQHSNARRQQVAAGA